MSETTKWFSQTLLTFKDKQFATDSYLRIAITTNTEDYKFFNSPMLNISISNSNNYQKTANLNIQNAEDLIESFEKTLQQLNGDDCIVEKHYNKLSKLFFKFAIETSSGERVVVIEIYSNDSDAVKIIIPLKPTFQSFLRRLRFFVQNYDQLCMTLLNKAIDFESTKIINQLPGLIKGISSQIVEHQVLEQDRILDTRAPKPDAASVSETETTSYDFEKFLGEDMENIKVPEIDEKIIEEKEKETIVEIESPFIDKVLKGDLNNLESKLNSFAVSKNPICDLANDLSVQLNFNPLNGITDDDEKSLVYISKLLMDTHSKAYTVHDVPIPSKTTILKYNGKLTDQNVSFAKDVLSIMGFMRIFTRRMETKVENAYDSKSLFYFYIRYMMDSYCFSFLNNFTHSEIKSSIINRFKYFDSIGFFDSYKSILKDHNCSPIEVPDIDAFAEQVYDSIVKTPMIDKVHEMMYEGNNIKLPSKNTFNLEQITNEFIPLEVNSMLGFDFTDKEAVEKLKGQGVSDEILKYFLGKKKVKKKSAMRKITPLQRVVEKFKQDIPDEYQEEVINHVKELEYNKFDFSKCVWPLEEFDTRVVVALYVWDPENDSEMKNNFTHFMSLVESEQMTKDDIIIATKEEKKEQSSSFGFEDINFEIS